MRVKALFRLLRPIITVEALIEAKRKGVKVTKHSPFGLTVEEYGTYYIVGGFTVKVDATKEEIERRLKYVNRTKALVA